MNQVTEQIYNNLIQTRGITSCVYDNSGLVQKHKLIGHVMLLDFDRPISMQKILYQTKDLDGINILWESSEESYGLWNLSLRKPEEILLLAMKTNADPKHIQIGYHFNYWVLRIDPKINNEIIYKPEPKYIMSWCNESFRIQSEPHFKLFIALTNENINLEKKFKFGGLSLDLIDYKTLTDSLKGKFH